MVNPESSFKEKIMQFIHTNLLVGHSSYLKTYKRAKQDFYWAGMKGNIKRLVRKCKICLTMKNETLPPTGLLQPLKISQQAWMDIYP